MIFLSRRIHRQKTSSSPESRPTPTGENQLASLDLHQSSLSTNKNDNIVDLTYAPTSTVTSKSGAGNSNSLPGHQSSRSKQHNSRLIHQEGLNLSDSVNFFLIKFLHFLFFSSSSS